jgi:hypothetical protein
MSSCARLGKSTGVHTTPSIMCEYIRFVYRCCRKRVPGRDICTSLCEKHTPGHPEVICKDWTVTKCGIDVPCLHCDTVSGIPDGEAPESLRDPESDFSHREVFTPVTANDPEILDTFVWHIPHVQLLHPEIYREMNWGGPATTEVIEEIAPDCVPELTLEGIDEALVQLCSPKIKAMEVDLQNIPMVDLGVSWVDFIPLSPSQIKVETDDDGINLYSIPQYESHSETVDIRLHSVVLSDPEEGQEEFGAPLRRSTRLQQKTLQV